jgi:hypothetical protein
MSASIQHSRDVVMIGLPTLGNVRTELESRLDEYKTTDNPVVHVRRISNVTDHAAARNHLVLYHFDTTAYTHLCFIDADTVPPAMFLESMLSVRHPVVSGVSHVWRPRRGQRQPEPMVALWQRREQSDGSDTYNRVEIVDRNQDVNGDGIATGAFCLLIESWVFDKMRESCGLPWFRTTYQDETQEKLWSEDLWFMRNLERVGISPLIMPSVVCDHYKTVSLADVERYGHAMYERGRRKGRAVVDVEDRLMGVSDGV